MADTTVLALLRHTAVSVICLELLYIATFQAKNIGQGSVTFIRVSYVAYLITSQQQYQSPILPISFTQKLPRIADKVDATINNIILYVRNLYHTCY